MKIDEVLTYNLKRLRKERKLSQRTLAKMAGLAHSSYINIEQGNRWPRLENIRAISEALGVPENDLFELPDTADDQPALDALKALIKHLKKGIPNNS